MTLPEVMAELTRIHLELGRQDVGDEDEHPHPRNCCMNLVAVVAGAEQAGHVQQAATDLAPHHPMRLLTLELEEAHNVGRIDAWIQSEAHELPGGMPIQFEMVRLHVTGTAAAEPVTIVEPLLVPDVPTYMWWIGSPPVTDDWFIQMLEVIDCLVVDSATFERPFITTLELAGLAAALGSRVGMNDLHWQRLGTVRELVAQFFSPADRRGFLNGINAVGIDYVGEGRGNRVAAALLVGWMASTLKWKLRRAAGGDGGTVAAYYEAHRGHPVEVDFRSVPAEGVVEGEIAALRLEAAASTRTARLAIERNPKQPTRAHMRTAIGESEPLEHWMPLDVPNEAELLVELVPLGRRDPIYIRSLDAAAELLRALR